MKPTDQQCIEIIESLELRSDIYDLKIDDIPIWWFIRFRFYEKLHDYLEAKEKKEAYFKNVPPCFFKIATQNYWQIIGFFFRVVIGGFFVITNQIKKGRIMFFTYQQNKREWEGNKKIDLFVGRIFEKLADQSIIVEQMSFSGGRMGNIYNYGGRLLFFDWAMFVAVIKNILKFFKKTKINNWDRFKKNCKEIDSQVVSLDWVIETIKELINSNIKKTLIQIEAAKIIVKKFKPKLIIETVNYNSGTVALNYVAKKHSIPIIELQHGIFNKFHLGYIYFLSKNQINKILPDKILVYGDFSKKVLLETSNAFSPQEIQVVGYLRLNRFLSTNLFKKETICKELRKKLGIDHNNFLITITSHYLISDFYIKFLKKALPLLGRKITICIKLHPMDNEKKEREKYKEITDILNVKILTDNEIDLYKLLISSNLHVTVYSTIFLECLALGVPNIIIDINKEFIYNFPEIANSKKIITVNNSDDLVSTIKELIENNNLRNRYINKGRELADYFFNTKENTEDSIIKEINKFL